MDKAAKTARDKRPLATCLTLLILQKKHHSAALLVVTAKLKTQQL